MTGAQLVHSVGVMVRFTKKLNKVNVWNHNISPNFGPHAKINNPRTNPFREPRKKGLEDDYIISGR